MPKRRAPKTWGEARRRHAMTVQRIIGLSRDPSVGEEAQTYWRALGGRAVTLLTRMDKEPAAAPYSGKTAAAPCATERCPGFVLWDARSLWDQAQPGARACIPELWCDKCHEDGVIPNPLRPPRRPVGLDPDELDELVEDLLARIVDLDRKLFAPVTLESVISLRLGEWDRWAQAWSAAQDLLERLLGCHEDKSVGPAAAAARLLSAREEAGTQVLMDAIPPAPEEPPPELQETALRLVPEPEPIQDEGPIAAHVDSGEPWVF